MVEFKLVISDPKTGKSVQRELKDDAAKSLVGKKIGDTFKGESIDLTGYEFQVCGGSDSAGFPMRPDVTGTVRKRITTVKGVGVKNKLRKPNPKKKGWRTINGMRRKKTVAGNTVYEKTAQINVKVIKAGKESLFEEAKSAEAPVKGAPAEEKKEETPKEEPKPAEKPAEGSAEVKEEDYTVKEEIKTAPEKTEEVIEEVEEVKLGDDEGEEVPISNPADQDESVDTTGEEESDDASGDDAVMPGVAGDSPDNEDAKKQESKEESKDAAEDKPVKVESVKDKPAKDDSSNEDAEQLVEDVENFDKEIEKDEEELKKEDEEIEKIEKEMSDDPKTEEKKE